MNHGKIKQAAIVFKEGKFFVSGELDFSNIYLLYKKSLAHVKPLPLLIFNFSELTSSNSAGIALAIEWIKYGKKHHKKVELENLPQNLLVIAEAGGVKELLSH